LPHHIIKIRNVKFFRVSQFFRALRSSGQIGRSVRAVKSRQGGLGLGDGQELVGFDILKGNLGVFAEKDLHSYWFV